MDLPPLMRSIQRIAIEEKWQKEVAKIIDTLKSSARKGKENPTSPNVLEVMSKLRKTTSIAKVCHSKTYCSHGISLYSNDIIFVVRYREHLPLL